MPRTKQFDRNNVLQRAMAVFHAKGFAGTSMDDLVREMGINRFSIYAEFGSKEELFHETIRCFRENMVARAFQPILAKDSGLGAIRDYFEALAGYVSSEEGWKGCLVTNSAVDAAWCDEATKQHAREHFRFMERAFRECLERAQARGELAPGKDPVQLAKLLLLATQGLGVVTKVSVGPRRARELVDAVLAALDE